MGEMRNVYSILVRKPEGKRPLGRFWRRWEDNIRKDLRETEWEVVDWIHLAQDRDHWEDLVKTILHIAGKFVTRSVTVSFLRRSLLHGVS
jgi:hypothetical protein